MSNDPNMMRGRLTFVQKINEAQLGNLGDLLIQEFADKVGIMPMDGLYSAKRLSDACIQCAPRAHGMETEDIFAAIIDVYNGTTSANNGFTRRLSNEDEIKDRGRSVEGLLQTGNIEHDRLTAAFNEEITSAEPIGETEEFYAEDEDGEIRVLNAEVIDLIEDAAHEGELSIEGMRAMGIINADFDTTSGIVTERDIERAQDLQAKEQQNWRMEDGMLIVLCPKCYSDKLYIGGGGMYGCFDCDEEFYFNTSLGDFLV